MLMLLSPAKTLNEGPVLTAFSATTPALANDVRILQKTVRALTPAKLRSLMGISADLASLNRQRHQELIAEPADEQSRQAMFLFAGDVYRGLDAGSMSEEAVAWSQQHVGILSGLYGVLRPLDKVQPYRLEMGTRLKTRRGTSLYAYWGDRISKVMSSWAADSGHTAIVNLASQEYFKAVSRTGLTLPVITPTFQDVKDGKARTLSFFAKQARGAMVRWAADNAITDPEELKQCNAMGYRFVPDVSTATEWVFQRPQPPPVSKK